MTNIVLKTALAFIACLFIIGSARAGETMPRYELKVSFETGKNLLRGDARITLPEDMALSLGTAGLRVIAATLDGVPLEPELINREGGMVLSGGSSLQLVYEAVLTGTAMDIQNVGVVGSVVSGEGISLTGRWYPEIGGLALYSLRAVVPDGFTAVSEADEIKVRDTPGGKEFIFHFPHPRDQMTLAAGRYEVISDTVGDTEIYAYFFKEDASLAVTYLDYTKRYIKMYDEMLGLYPYKRFSVVENFLPTGYSMPTYTLLGRDVVLLPFIVETSLGHEILHQWFGNSVYGDPAGGNWLEGLTTYLSDHLYEERKGEGSAYRKKAMVEYQSYVNAGNAAPLRDFQGRVDPPSKAIGYGKGAMFFHMLKERVGGEGFYRALRTFVESYSFRRASWVNIREVFEDISGEPLENFFAQWLDRSDIPSLEVVSPSVRYLQGTPHVLFKLKQNTEEPYELRVKAKISTEKGEQTETLETGEKEKSFDLAVKGKPVEMVLDGDYDLMRRLQRAEFPPVVARLLGDEKRIIVKPAEGAEVYSGLTQILEEEGFTAISESEIKDEDIVASSVLLLGRDGPVHRRLFGAPVTFEESEGFVFKVMNNPLNPDKVVAVSYASGKDEVDAAARKIFRYGKYSYLKFETGRNVKKEVAGSDDGIKVNLFHKVTGIRPGDTLGLEKIIENVIEKTIIYVGESHTTYQDHRVQLEVIRALSERGRNFAIGMEMFERPFQEALDDYIADKTTEREFLKASEYFKRWQFDYNLYREIIEFAKANSIPVIALNIDSGIIRKVSAGGLDALPKEDKEKIPPDMDMTDGDYRNRLREVFGMHESSGRKDFENFYQSQILWDETMAHSISDYLSSNPGHQIVVLSGVGHVAWGSGIPKRAYRLTGRDYAILINADTETPHEGIADYVLFPEPLELAKTPALGVMIEKTDEGVRVAEVKHGSAAEGAGIKKGDIVVSMDGLEVDDVADIKIALFGHETGDSIAVRILRKRLFGMKEMELTVAL